MKVLPAILRLPITLFCVVLFLVVTLIIPIPILAFAGIRALTPNKKLQKKLTAIVEECAIYWTDFNHILLRKIMPIEWHIIGQEKILPNKDYLVIANHQSWMDIPILEEALYRKSGFSRYFIKKNLLHIPLCGWACRALHYPYMYRYGKEFLAKHPEYKGRDIAITKKACAKLKEIPFKLNSFPEGTRFTAKKHAKQRSPYAHLLHPRAGGLSYALQILHEDFFSIVNLTIVYIGAPKSILGFLFGGVQKVYVYIELLPITPDLIGDYQDDRDYRVHFQAWLNHVWRQKDQLIIDTYRKEIH